LATASAERSDRSVRRLATEILVKVDVNKAYADVLLDRALKSAVLDERDGALLTELTYGTLRWRGNIDARLSRHVRRPLTRCTPLTRNLLRVSAYQLLFLHKVPDYAAVNEAVELAKIYGGRKAAGFINGVLRNLLRAKERAFTERDESIPALAAAYSHPEWLVTKWTREFGAEPAKELMRANNEKAPLVLRVNSLKSARDRLLQSFLSAGIKAKPARWSPTAIEVARGAIVEKLPGHSEGLFQVQGEASQLIAYLLSPEPGERILDACAAPGGKSTQIAEMMADRGELVAVDVSARGIDRLLANAARLGLQSIRAVRADIRQEIPEALRGPYDRILVDAPCSGLGTLRGHPEIKWQRDETDIQRLSRLQSQILRRVVAYLRPGGVLVYSTCTLARAENEDIVTALLAEHASFELEEAARYLPQEARSMTRGRYFLALPHVHNTDGFFAARLRKVG